MPFSPAPKDIFAIGTMNYGFLMGRKSQIDNEMDESIGHEVALASIGTKKVRLQNVYQ